MNKETFLMQLEQLLYDIPREEREEAMDYYRSYFEDAGVENEAAVLEELESPQSVAAGIKEGLGGAGDKPGSLKNPPQLRNGQSEAKKQAGSYEYGGQTSQGPDSYRYGGKSSQGPDSYGYGRQSSQGPGSYEYGGQNSQSNKSSQGPGSYGYGGQSSQSNKSSQGPDSYEYGNKGGPNGRYAQYGQQERNDQKEHKDYKEQFPLKWMMSSKMKWILAILLLIFVLPNMKRFLSFIFGLAGIVIGAAVLLVITAAGGIIGGMICVIVGIVKVCMMSLASGLLILGVGLLLIAAGGISVIILVLFCVKVLPWAVDRISDLIHSILEWGRSKV